MSAGLSQRVFFVEFRESAGSSRSPRWSMFVSLRHVFVLSPRHLTIMSVFAPLVGALERCKAIDRVCVAAFSDRRLSRVRRLSGGRVCTALGPTGITRLRMASYGARTGRFAGGCVQVPTHIGKRVLVDQRFVDTAHRRHLPVHVWTIDERRQMERLLDLGVDGIMTDRPTALKEVLVERGQWAE